MSGTDADDFTLVAGVLTFKATPDFEMPSDRVIDINNDGDSADAGEEPAGGNTYQITVGAASGGDEDSIAVTVTVVNEEEPGMLTLSTLQPQVEQAITATLEDPDGNVRNMVWRWDRSTENPDIWSIRPGVTAATYTPIPADAGWFIRASVSYEDGHGFGKNQRATTDGRVGTPPVFAGETALINVDENTQAGVDIGAPFNADDPGDTLTYSLDTGVGGTHFMINAATGQLMTKEALDYEKQVEYTVTVTATDGAGGDDSIVATITVLNIEEMGTLTLSPETADLNMRITATLADPDGGIVDEVWQWSSSDSIAVDAVWTDIAGAMGMAYTPTVDDHGMYIRATVSYGDAEGSGKSAMATTTDAVDVNFTPEFTDGESVARTVDEDTAAAENIGDPIAATDVNDDDTLTYSLGGADAASFAIDSATGQLMTEAALDYETQASYSVDVMVQDSRDEMGAADTAVDDTIAVTITVTNVEEDGSVTLTTAEAGTAAAVEGAEITASLGRR